jgi:hypothetical protein
MGKNSLSCAKGKGTWQTHEFVVRRKKRTTKQLICRAFFLSRVR